MSLPLVAIVHSLLVYENNSMNIMRGWSSGSSSSSSSSSNEWNTLEVVVVVVVVVVVEIVAGEVIISISLYHAFAQLKIGK
jgi:hypothetical protein